ncbi:MAG: UDP-N-acetylmuramoyl-tripeptide--D-alanyl-D-alanine ligase [Cycloclasticus sp.]|nr:MAG: UDP-N-acetylmuramoyl-tripeptide--D-alanyl-D-alanine ligase [Cycloclasticus sp.]
MRIMSLQQLAAVTNGTVHGADVTFNAISSDTRTLEVGELFVALQGENFDANKFAEQAKNKGAVAALLSADSSVDMPYIKVADTLKALTQLATAEREKTTIPVIGITGSNGKTSVKEMLVSILSPHMKVLATQGNLNNQIGVPLTLLKLTKEHQVAVIEMGASQQGDIRHLCGIAKPTVAILNNIAAAHLAGFGDLEGVASAKSEIISGLNDAGTAVLNREEPWFEQWVALAAGKKVTSFGWSNTADVWADIASVKTGLTDGVFSTSFVLNYQQQSAAIRLNLVGQHNVLNALAASAAAISLAVSLEQVQQGLAVLKPVSGRLQPFRGLAGSVVVNDCYNANPKSFEAAMDSLAQVNIPVWLVLGDFAELGVNSQQIHQQIGEALVESNVQRVFAVGDNMQCLVNAFNQALSGAQRSAEHFPSKRSMVARLVAEMRSDTVVLVKGSRSQGLESVIQEITLQEGHSCC